MRRTKIVATIGPACDAPGVLTAVIAAGIDVARLNSSHGSPEDLARRLAAVRAEAKAAGRVVGVLLDLPGPKLRVDEIADGTVLVEGSEFRLSAAGCTGDSTHACVTYAGLAADVASGDRIMLDDGAIELVVEGASDGDVTTRVVRGGPLSSHKGVNVPGVRLAVDGVTQRDFEWLAWGLDAGVDMVAQSFVRSADDVLRLRAAMGGRTVPIVAKIEKYEALAELAGIVAAADAVMVARGDLGVETSPEAVPVLQRRIITEARAAGKPVVVATQMLESMTAAPRPTRAEASDVANAIFERADAVMLSGETAVGEYPVEAVQTMARIASAAEEVVSGGGWDHRVGRTHSVQQAVSAAVCDLASDLDLAAIVPVTESGATARAVAQHRPDAPIVAATTHERTARQLGLVWGVRTVLVPVAQNNDELLDSVCQRLVAKGLTQPGDKVALTTGRAPNAPGGTDFILVRDV